MRSTVILASLTLAGVASCIAIDRHHWTSESRVKAGVRLRTVSPVYLRLSTPSAADGDSQLSSALGMMTAQFQGLGFTIAPDSTHAASIAELSVDGISRDGMTDKGQLSFRKENVPDPFASFLQEGHPGTVSVRDMVRRLIEDVETNY